MIPASQIGSDQAARDRIRTSLHESLIVEASAGTGKTTELVHRIVAVLEHGLTTIDRIVAVTFTHKAAGELKLRLREELDKARQRAPRLEDALGRLEEASIGTIHSFCAQILRERPVEARVDPSFEELNEQESARLFQRAFRVWLERRLNEDSPGLRRAFARLAWRDSWDDTPPVEQLQFAGKKLIEWRDYPAAWHRDESFDRVEEMTTIARMVRELAEASSRPRRVTDNLYKSLAPVRALAGSMDRAESSGSGDPDALESLLLKLGRDLRRDLRKGSGVYGEGIPREDLVAKRDNVLRWIEDFRRRADADLAAALRDEMSGLLDEYEDRKSRTGKLDFVDLLIKVRDLVREQPVVRQYLQNRFTHLFVDEFQDTDPLQAEILLLLSADDPDECEWSRVRPKPGKLFLVGDPKQSIYKFRRADLVMYRDLRRALGERGVECLTLTRSYRAVRNIQQFVNAAFETEMNGDAAAGQADWAPLEEHRAEPEDRPSVIVLPVPRPYKSRIAKEAINRSLPDAIAAFVHWLIDKQEWGYRARDIAVLLRRRTQAGSDLTREYVRGLEARGIPHLLAGSKSFHRREEIETLRAAVTAIEWPDDELSVFATLKGSLFAIPDEILLRYRHAHGRLHPFHRPEDEPDAVFGPVLEALAILGDLHRQRNRQPFAATVNALLEATRAHAGFVLRPGGNQILANVARLADLARVYEISGGISFRGFVDELAAQAEKEEASEAPVLEEDSDGVRLLTVHGAKGLEFPVVILADLTANLAAREPDQFVDGARRLSATRLLRCAPRELSEHEPQESARERAEGIRVAYVAATRARDLLVIPAVGDDPFEGWLSPLNKAIYPSRANWRKSARASGCPEFGNASVLDRPLEYAREQEFSVKPGLIEPEHGTHKVVWWDPAKLKLNVDQGLGLRQKEILAEDGGQSLTAYREWEKNRIATLSSGGAPQFDVFLASQASEAPPTLIEVSTEFASVSEGRPRGNRFGTLVHAAMRDVDLDATPASIAGIVELNGRSIGAPKEEIEAACVAVEAALAHPLLARARAAERCHREYPITLKLDHGRLLEGILDLAFVENGQWTIVDFKTDAGVSERRERYERQLQWYAYALTQLTNMPARAYLLGV
ncbi:MAG TPA: UvrD-helicase domain-containing protein [Bryobacteraceae bacterium]|nr:UvrD-helicase domain-containing protein [Bryobacteraceae bacterium]